MDYRVSWRLLSISHDTAKRAYARTYDAAAINPCRIYTCKQRWKKNPSMIVHALSKRLLASIMRRGESNAFSPLLGAFAFLATITLTVPVEWLVVVGTLTSRRRWVSVALCAATGSALAALGLYFAFHHLGWSLLLDVEPQQVVPGQTEFADWWH